MFQAARQEEEEAALRAHTRPRDRPIINSRNGSIWRYRTKSNNLPERKDGGDSRDRGRTLARDRIDMNTYAFNFNNDRELLY